MGVRSWRLVGLDSVRAKRVFTDETLWSQMDLRSDEETAQLRERLEPYLLLIPEVEHKVIDAYFRGLTEQEIAAHYGCSQAAVSYRLTRAVQRLKWWVNRPPKPETFRNDILAALERSFYQTKWPLNERASLVEYAIDESSVTRAQERAEQITGSKWSNTMVRNWCIQVEKRLTGASLEYFQYSFRHGKGMVHEAVSEAHVIGKLSRETKGKL